MHLATSQWLVQRNSLSSETRSVIPFRHIMVTRNIIQGIRQFKKHFGQWLTLHCFKQLHLVILNATGGYCGYMGHICPTSLEAVLVHHLVFHLSLKHHHNTGWLYCQHCSQQYSYYFNIQSRWTQHQADAKLICPIRCSSGTELLTNLMIIDTFSTLDLSLIPSPFIQNPGEFAFKYLFLTSPRTTHSKCFNYFVLDTLRSGNFRYA